MPINNRIGSTVLPGRSPVSILSFDPITRRTVRFIETIVPTVDRADSKTLAFMAADRFYAYLGAMNSSTVTPGWLTNFLRVAFQNWDATDRRFYLRGPDPTGAGGGVYAATTDARFIHYGGVGGVATTHAPKNADVSKVIIEFRARFNANADYTTNGIGASSVSATPFDSGHMFQVLRNAGTWELGTRDGTTTSQASGGTANGSFHDFRVDWDSTQLVLSVDGVSTITKTTNLPTQPLLAIPLLTGTTDTIDIVDYAVRWE